ncbi:hypothetical protein Tco_1087731 [Tanacetum coccineum]
MKSVVVPTTLSIALKIPNKPLLNTHPYVQMKQENEMTNKIDTVLKAISNRITRALPGDTVKNPKLSTTRVLSARSYPTIEPQCSTQIHSSINAVTLYPKQSNEQLNDESDREDREERSNPKNIDTALHSPHDPLILFIIEKVRKLNLFLQLFGWVPQSSDTEIVCTKGDDEEVMFIEIVRTNDDSREEGPNDEGSTTIKGFKVEYFDSFLTRSELACHKYLMCGLIPLIFPRNPIITKGCPSNLKIPCNIRCPHQIEQYNSLSDLENEHMKSVYLRNEEDKRRGVEYVMSKILGFYKECLELGPKYATRMDDEGEVM